MKFNKQPLDLEELEILNAVEASKLKSVSNVKNKIKIYQAIAKAQSKKSYFFNKQK